MGLMVEGLGGSLKGSFKGSIGFYMGLMVEGLGGPSRAPLRDL